MTYQQIVKHFGGVTQAAKSLGFTRAGVYYWRDNGIPLRTQEMIHWLTDRKLKVTAK